MLQSLTSRAMGTITEWRNPQGREENWLQEQYLHRELPSYGKRIGATVAYAVTTVAALVETVASLVITQLSSTLALIDRQPFEKSLEWLESSSFTVLWSFSNMLLFNFKTPNLFTEELRARKYTAQTVYRMTLF
jgi:hypothetical protein